jgi:thiol-disulfide isomerase/thioredoxin
MRRGIRIASLTLWALGLLAAGLYLSRQIGVPDRLPADQATNTAPAVDTLPEFVLADINGRPRSISEWSDRAVLINFWATWCAPCRREMPLLQKLHEEQLDNGIVVIGIAIDRLPDVQAFTTEAGITYAILVGQDDAIEVTDMFGLDFLGLPFSVLADSAGKVLKIQIGELHPQDLRAFVAVTEALRAGHIDTAEARRRLQDR